MPLYAYRCACGEVLEALVRAGEHPADARALGHTCETDGTLTRLVTAHNVGKPPGQGSAPTAADCGRCGGTPGSCGYPG